MSHQRPLHFIWTPRPLLISKNESLPLKLNPPPAFTIHFFYFHSLAVQSGWNYKELICPLRDSPRSMHALGSAKKKKKTHTWWELWNNAASGMFPRWPVGSDGGPSGCLEGFMGNLTHTYRVTRSNVSCASPHLDVLLFVLDLKTHFLSAAVLIQLQIKSVGSAYRATY